MTPREPQIHLIDQSDEDEQQAESKIALANNPAQGVLINAVCKPDPALLCDRSAMAGCGVGGTVRRL